MYKSWLRNVLSDMLKSFDVFISYRWGEFDKHLAQSLFERLSLNYSVDDAGNNRLIRVFLDTKVLEDGSDFQAAFAQSLQSSKVLVPILSVDALTRMLTHNPMVVDNVLLEWFLGLACHQIGSQNQSTELGAVKIYPLLIGTLNSDKIENLFTSNTSDTTIKIGNVFNFYKNENKKNVWNSLPDIVPTETIARAKELLSRGGVDITNPILTSMETYTVKQIVHTISRFMGLETWNFDKSKLGLTAAERVVRILKSLLSNDENGKPNYNPFKTTCNL
jgi:hypothetical protein